MNRMIVLAGAAVAAVAVAALLSRGGPGEAVAPEPQAPGSGPAQGPAERAPEFERVRGDEDRLVHWLATLASGDEDDVAWAVARLRRAGPSGRRVVRDAALAAVDSNPALLEQALDFLAKEPEEIDTELARRALGSVDPDAVVRAMRLLAAAPGTRSAADLAAIADTAIARTPEIRREALSALAKIGGDAAAGQALRLVGAMPVEELPVAYTLLGQFKSEIVRSALSERFASAEDVALRFTAADALVTGGDTKPLPWLESLLVTPPAGPFDYADAALGVLAKTRHRGALAKIGAAAAGTLTGADARMTAIERLGAYPIEDTREFLEAAARPAAEGEDQGVRVEALDALRRAGVPGMTERLEKLVREGDRNSVYVAALLFGRMRRPEAAACLTDGIRRADLTDETRAILLRALVLSGAPSSAEFVVKAIVDDHGAPGATGADAPPSLAFNAVAMLSDATQEFRAAAAPHLTRALRGEMGQPSGVGLVQLIRAAGICCGPEACDALLSFVSHADMGVRLNAALALGHVARAGDERDLRAAWWRVPCEDTRSALRRAMERAHFAEAR